MKTAKFWGDGKSETHEITSEAMYRELHNEMREKTFVVQMQDGSHRLGSYSDFAHYTDGKETFRDYFRG